MDNLAHIGPAMTTAFLASLVEAVEALTIVLAVATVRGWRPAGLGAFAGLLVLALIVVALGPLLDRVPLHLLQLAIGILLLLFGMRWLRKAILRSAGVIPLHDELTTFAAETAELREQARRNEARLDWLAALASFKAVLLEGLEVVFIVIALSAGRGMLIPRVQAQLRRACWSLAWALSCIGRWRGFPKIRSNSPSASCCPHSASFGPAKVSAWPGRAQTSRSSDLPSCSLPLGSRQSRSCVAPA